MNVLSRSISVRARQALAAGLRQNRAIASGSSHIVGGRSTEYFCQTGFSRRSSSTITDIRGKESSILRRYRYLSTATPPTSLLADMLKEHRVFERVDIRPGKMFHVLNVIEDDASISIGATLQQAIVQELASADLAEMDDMFYLVGCVMNDMKKTAQEQGCYDRIDDASDYHSLKEYLLGYKIHSFQMTVLPTISEEGVLTELVRVTQPGGFVVYTSSTEPTTVAEASTLQDSGKWKLIEAKPADGVEGPTLNLCKVAE